jgi:hypothetical protein
VPKHDFVGTRDVWKGGRGCKNSTSNAIPLSPSGKHSLAHSIILLNTALGLRMLCPTMSNLYSLIEKKLFKHYSKLPAVITLKSIWDTEVTHPMLELPSEPPWQLCKKPSIG